MSTTLTKSTISPNGLAAVSPRLRTWVEDVTPGGARSILNTRNWSRQRPLRRQHVAYLVDCINLGELTTLSLMYGELPDGQLVLVDGQHRLDALSRTAMTLPAVVTSIAVADDDAIARLFATIDRQSTRTPADMLRASGLEERSGVSVTVLRDISSAAGMAQSGFSQNYRPVRSMIQRTQATEEWLPEGREYHGCLEGGDGLVVSYLWRMPVAAVGLATLRHQPERAVDFWHGAAQEDGLSRNDPRAQLVKWLRAHRSNSHGTFIYARYVAAAWNAFFERREIERVQVSDASGPMRLFGTPYMPKAVKP